MLRPSDDVMGIARSYGPLALAAALFLVMALAVEPLPRTRQSLAGSVEVPIPGAMLPAEGEAEGSDGAPAGAAPGRRAAAAGARGGGDTTGVTPCADRAQQVRGDPYSPPCYAFSGDNGGVTSRGVSANEIIVAARVLEGPSAAEIFADLSGENVRDSEAAVRDTVHALAEYFSSRFNFYGRRIRIEFFKGQGNGASELLGAGKERALADAVQSAQEIGAFADLTGLTIPYADALARQGVVNIGAPYPSRRWFVDRRPYAWSFFPDGTRVVEASSSAAIARLSDQNVAEYAGEGLRGQQRKYALVAPENAEYQESVRAYLDILGRAGIQVAMNITYKLDIASMPNQASGIIAQLKDAGVTSIFCGCDPVMLALGLAPKSNEQSYFPEWITAGLAFVEQDIVSQLIDSRQWQRAFGIAFNAESEPQGRSYPYAAYKQMRPNDEPAFGVEEIYYQMYMLAIGLQMAGPNLTPETFEAGMFAYPGGAGPRGSWAFGPGNYTPIEDFRELWWDPERISPQNNRPGAWVQLFGGRRYLPGEVPRGRAPFFER